MAETIPELPDNPYRLGRHVNHDERSRNFPFLAAPQAPASVEWARRAPVFDQGQLGSCTGNAAAGWLGTDNAVRKGLTTVTAPLPDGTLDENDAIEIYHQATVLDPYPGTYPPDDTGSDGLSVTKVLQSMGYVDSYTHGFNFQAVLSALQVGPVLFGTNWYQGMFTPDSQGFVKVSGSIAGGHEYVCVGVDVDGTLWNKGAQVLKFTNSWGTSFADHGYFYMTYATAQRLLSESGDATVPHAVVVAPPTPPTPPTPTGKTIDHVVILHTSGQHATYHTVEKVTTTYSDGTVVVQP
jgi:hypothetical protein